MAFHKDLEDEKVRAYLTGTGINGWQDLGVFTTNSDGKIYVPVDGQEAGQYKLRMVVLGDLTYADAHISSIDRGYQPIFITARTYWQAKDTREWLRDAAGLPEFIMRTALSNGQGLNEAAEYKTEVLQEFQAAGLDIVRAYGNADTDAQAFNNAGIPLDSTYMIGDNAGINGTQPIYDEGYLQHISDVVLNTEHSGCN